MEKQGEDTQNWMKDTGIPSYEDYVGMRDMVTDYTAGHLMVTSWRWRSHEVEPGQSAGLCIGEQDDAKGAYWSCWEYQRREDGGWDDMPKAYLVNPANFTADSRLHHFENLNVDSFPGMLGGWMCFEPMEIMMDTYTDCMRFLPSEAASTPEDYLYQTGPIRVMTYLTSRADNSTQPATVNENDSLMTDGY